jgi:hypothetical protein
MLVAVLVRSSDRVLWLRQYFGSYEPMAVRAQIDQLRAGQVPVEFLLLYFAIPAALLLPPTFLMGFSFPILQRVVQTDFSRLGRRLGSLMLANIAGSVAGTIVAGLAALNALGTAGTLRALAIVSMLFAFAMLGAAVRARMGLAILAGAVAVCGLALRVFPYVVSASGVLVGSSDPMTIDRDALARRIADPRVREHYARAGINVQEMMSQYLARPAIYTPDFNRDALTDVNSDLFPKDEFDLRPLP